MDFRIFLKGTLTPEKYIFFKLFLERTHTKIISLPSLENHIFSDMRSASPFQKVKPQWDLKLP